ncbi:uncharacterized protein si:ch211-212k18.13 isoform X2 [Megalobrama amblycephala]|uniref:uncharacterized protein si:ch211-212k18.13 isoform X2 n=1 Tax=Megalobrama amblycephala TaxID=75352 RepID=UPI0020144726|nr:uncharacterized protein si:ch211-212k18.13 isoform X2 [Megalobrama amblycephala]
MNFLRVPEENMSFIKGFRNEVQYNGLKNQGATCYLNAVLQCLFMTPEFREAVESYKAPGDCGEENLLLQLQKLFTQLSEKTATTGEITKSLGIRSVFEQQDAVEYYRKILKAVGTHASKEKSLKTFFEHSKLEEDDWMYCEGCERKTETETWSEIHEYPTVLALHLKRFDFDYIQMRYEKNECRLDVPLSLPEENNRPRYDLYAVINHKGGYSGGHYDTVIRSYENGIWYRFDDYTVTQTSESSLENSSLPYMLMYRKSLSSGSIKTAALNPGSIPHPMRILLIGPSRAGKSTVGNIILGGSYFLCKSGSETVTKASMVKTVGKVTVVDTPNLFSLSKSSWDKEMQKLSDPGPSVILWVTPISKFSEQQQGLFHTFKKRLDSRTTKRMMIIFTNGRQLKEFVQPIDRFISDHRKLCKVVHCCQNRYHVIDITDGHNYTSELLQKLSEMVTSKEATAITPMQLKCLRRSLKKKTTKNIKATKNV